MINSWPASLIFFIMVNMRSTTSGGNNSDGDHEAIAEMHAAMEDTRHHNQNLEDNILNLRQRQ